MSDEPQIITQSLYEEAIVLYKNHKYEEAVALFEEAAEQGHAGAQYHLGKCYEWKHAGQKLHYKERNKEAVRWYTKAAKQGHAEAQLCLGTCYYLGKGVSVNLKESFEWKRKAAEQGHAVACYSLAGMYETGYGIKENGKILKLVEKSKKQYRYWLSKGLEDTNIEHITAVAQYFGSSRLLKREREFAFKYAKKVAEEGTIPDIKRYLGTYYMYGIGTEKNYIEGIKWTTLAAEEGDYRACNVLSYYYSEGYGV